MRHDCINVRLPSGRVYEWEFKVEGGSRKLTPPSRLMFNDVGLVLEAVLQGKGIAQLGGYLICDLLREGKLVHSMPQYAPDDRGHYICYLSRQHLPSRIRVFVDHMTAAIRALDLQCAGAFSPTRDDRQAASAPSVGGQGLELICDLSTDPYGERVAAFPLGNTAPEEPCERLSPHKARAQH